MPKPSNTTTTTDATTDTLGSATLLDQIMAETKLVPAQEGYQVARQGVSAFIAEILKSNDPDQLINKHRADQMIAEIDRLLSKQMDVILHQPEFQQLESSWRSLKLLVDRTDFRENIKLEILHVSKEELLDDFENAADITCSGIYKHVYTAGYGQFGGEPVAAMVGNYNFGPSSPDIKLLSYMASVGAMSHAPFLAAPAPEFFNLSSFEEPGEMQGKKNWQLPFWAVLFPYNLTVAICWYFVCKLFNVRAAPPPPAAFEEPHVQPRKRKRK